MTLQAPIDQPVDKARQKLADALRDIENDILDILHRTGLIESLEVDEIVADAAKCDPTTADIELRWSKLKIYGFGPSRRVLSRQLRAFADELDHLECKL